MMAVPFLYPWANRLDGFHYRAGGHDVTLDPASPLVLLDEHGLPRVEMEIEVCHAALEVRTTVDAIGPDT
jgi:hypothetical protein